MTVDDAIASAEKSSSDSSEIRVPGGSISLAWVYGARRHVPRLWGSLEVKGHELPDLAHALDRLAIVCGATYGVCDLEAVRQEAMRAGPDMYESGSNIVALRALYWYNYFGVEYRRAFAISEQPAGSGARLGDLESGAFRVVLAPSPTTVGDDPGISRTVARDYPFFRKYDPKASFKSPVWIDYSEVWGLPSPSQEGRPVREVVGPPDGFIAGASSRAELFRQWLGSQGLPQANTEEDFIAIFRAHEAVIRDEFLVPAIAAYGEMVRTKTNGEWRKAMLLNRGEPIVVRRGRPWRWRRVVLEVLELLEPIDE